MNDQNFFGVAVLLFEHTSIGNALKRYSVAVNDQRQCL